MGKRDLKNHGGFCFGIGLIVCAAVFLCLLFVSVNHETISAVHILKEQNMEDFYYIPFISENLLINKNGDYNAALEELNDELADKYDFKWESHNYKYIDGEKKYKCYIAERTIDQLLISQGELPKEGQVLVNQKFFDMNHYKIGEKLEIAGKEYSIAGVAYFPDMIYPQVSMNGSGYDEESEALVAMTDGDYTELKEDETIACVGKFNHEDKVEEMRNDSQFSYLMTAKENLNILSFVNSKLMIHIIVFYIVVGIFSAITCLMVFLLVMRLIEAEMPQLGILKAIGYTEMELSRNYFSMAIIFIVSCILAMIMLWFIQPIYYNAYNSVFELPESGSKFPVAAIVFVCTVVILAFTLFAFGIAMIQLKRSALSLIKKSSIKKKNSKSIKINMKSHAKTYLKNIRHIQMKTNKSSYILILVAGFSVGALLQISFLMGNVTNNLADDATRGLHYKNDVRLQEKCSNPDDKGLYYYGMKTRLCDSNKKDIAAIDLYLLNDEDKSMLELKNKKGKPIEVNELNGVVINEWMSLKYGLLKGDTIYLKIESKSYKFKIAEVSNAIFGNVIYYSMENGILDGIIADRVYNGLLTNENISSGVAYQIATRSIEENITNTNSIYEINSLICLICGLVIGIPLLILSFMNIINDAGKSIAILKINGYLKKECNYVVLSGYRSAAYLGLLISIPYTYMIGKVLFTAISKTSTMIFSLYVNQYSIIITSLGVILLTEGFIATFKRRIIKISYKELIEK